MPNTRTVCYCKQVTEETLLNHIVHRQCCHTLTDIQRHTGANTGNQCHLTHPAGL